ncbi:hypothetical protein KJ765_04755 [Candidatus Micrarchaeota archaeon]|nr:hypothetical protein [Candidatus Micrarchaeota archaeon]
MPDETPNKEPRVEPQKDPEKQYTEREVENMFKEAGKRGAILVLLHFDAYGTDKEIIKQALVDLVGRVTNEAGVIYCRGEIEEVIEKENAGKKQYSTFTEIKVLFESISRAVSLCMKYAPIAIEVLEPKELKLKANEIQNLMLDASGVSQQFTAFYMEKLLKGEEKEEFQKNLKERAEHGKAALKKAEENAKTADEPKQ